jgi:molybdopterin molybdotransferase
LAVTHPMLSHEAARAKVIEVVNARAAAAPQTETIEFAADPSRALGRILAEDVIADRNYPPFDRSTRDGFAVRVADAANPGIRLRLIGESRAGQAFDGQMEAGSTVQIMTGAPLPRGANAVVMLEDAEVEGDYVVVHRAVRPGQHYVVEGQETRAGESVIKGGKRLGYAELAMAAQVGRSKIEVAKKPRVAILSTGDEVIAVGNAPRRFQIRNSNCISLAAQVSLAGGEPMVLGNAPDDVAELRVRIEEALKADIVILTGGVSVGKYDLVEQVLKEMHVEFFFDAIAIRPGRPAVFGARNNTPVFGLPGNPVSTMVTFELLVVPAIEAMSGHPPGSLHLFKAKLAHPVEEKPPLAHFLPARVKWPDGQATAEALHWEGSGDIGAVVRGNCFLVVHASKQKLEAGEMVDILPRRGLF